MHKDEDEAGGVTEALLVVTGDGSVGFATEHALAWLGEHLGSSAQSTLPADVRDWLKRSRRDQRRCRPLTLEAASSQLVVSLLHAETDGAYGLLLQRRPSGMAACRTRNLGLTKRQAEVHALLKEGKTNSEIADRLGIGCATAKRHVEDVLARLHVRNRAAAAGVP